MPGEHTSFKPEVAGKLRTYVYRLIDPRNGETFYVGKGQGNRVFAHIREQVDEDDPTNKLLRIRDIHLAGFEVAHVIHRHTAWTTGRRSRSRRPSWMRIQA